MTKSLLKDHDLRQAKTLLNKIVLNEPQRMMISLHSQVLEYLKQLQ